MKTTGLSQKVFSGSYAVGGNGTTNTFNVEATLAKFPFLGDIILQLVVARTAGASTTDAKLQVSLDNGVTYNDFVTFTQISAATGSEVKSVSAPLGAKIKAVLTLGSATTSTIALYVCGAAHGGAGK